MARIFGLDFTNVEKYLDSYGAYLVRQGQSRLNKRRASGNLRSSLRHKLFKTREKYVLMLLSARYGEFVEKGVSGTEVVRSYIDRYGKRKTSPFKYKQKQPPSFQIERFIKAKGIKGRKLKASSYRLKDGTVKYRKDRGQFITNKSLAFLIARSIKRKGIKAASYYTQPLSYSYKYFKRELLANFKKDSLEAIQLIYKDRK